MKLTIKEVIWILVAILIFWIIIGVSYNTTTKTLNFNLAPSILLVTTVIILTTTLAKKTAAPRYSSKTEIDLWWFERWGWYKRSTLPKPIPMGIIFPLLLTILSLGYIKPMIFLQSNETNNLSQRLLRKQGTRRAQRKMELNESDPAFISSYSLYSLLILAIIGTILTTRFNIPLGYTLAKYSIFYGAWNLIPFAPLDGAKTFYGSLYIWTFLVIFYIIALLILGITAVF